MTYRHPPEIKAQAIKMHEGGMSQRAIARALGIHQSSISPWVNPEALRARQERDRARNANPYYRSKKNKRQQGNAYKTWRAQWVAARCMQDPSYRALRVLAGRIRDALKKGSKSASTRKLLGICVDDLIDKWNAEYGLDWPDKGLHIDHIRPCASFDLADPDQQVTCFNWRNLQLLPAKENIAKGSTWTKKMEEDWIDRMRLMGFEGELFERYL